MRHIARYGCDIAAFVLDERDKIVKTVHALAYDLVDRIIDRFRDDINGVGHCNFC